MTTSADIDVCVLEDDLDQQRLIARVLDNRGLTVSAAADAMQGLEAVARARPKVILCDVELPDRSGVEVCRSLRKNPEWSTCYIMLMSASALCDLSAAVVDAGADDYLAKPIDHEELVARVRVGMRMSSLHDQLRRAAITDGLTGLHNHDHFNRLLESEMSRTRRYGHPLALIMMDMDFFKAINDTFGHLVGNAVLEKVAFILRESIREVDSAARFGGDEFVIILPQATIADALQVAERIRATLAESLRIEALHGHSLTASLGIADSDDPRVSCAADLVDMADRALYLAKHRGRNQAACSNEVEEGAELVATLQDDEVVSLKRRLTALSVRAKDVYMQSVASLLQALDEKDPFTARHAVNTSFYAKEIAEQMGCSKAIVKAIKNAALLHDIGKVGVPDKILMKRTPLTRLERMVIDQVPAIGTRIVDHLRILETEVQIIRHQREHFDGSGFPAGMRGTLIPVGARILLVANAFDAITTDRVYRKHRGIEEALAEIDACADTQFDPRVVMALRQVVQRDRVAWQRRIDDTVAAMRVPSGDREAAVPEFSRIDPI